MQQTDKITLFTWITFYNSMLVHLLKFQKMEEWARRCFCRSCAELTTNVPPRSDPITDSQGEDGPEPEPALPVPPRVPRILPDMSKVNVNTRCVEDENFNSAAVCVRNKAASSIDRSNQLLPWPTISLQSNLVMRPSGCRASQKEPSQRFIGKRCRRDERGLFSFSSHQLPLPDQRSKVSLFDADTSVWYRLSFGSPVEPVGTSRTT